MLLYCLLITVGMILIVIMVLGHMPQNTAVRLLEVMNLLYHLRRLGRVLLLMFPYFGTDLIQSHRNNHIRCEGKHDHGTGLVGYVQHFGGNNLLEKRGQLTLQNIQPQSSAQHTQEEDIAFCHRQIQFASQKGNHRNPVYPDKWIDNIDDKTLHKDCSPARVAIFTFKLYPRTLFLESSDLFTQIVEAHRHKHRSSDRGHPHIMEQLIQINILQNCQHQENYDYIRIPEETDEEIIFEACVEEPNMRANSSYSPAAAVAYSNTWCAW